MSKPLTARRVRRARRIITKDACPGKWGIRHHWGPTRSPAAAGLFVRCVNCGEVR